jgi:hypothetical protein
MRRKRGKEKVPLPVLAGAKRRRVETSVNDQVAHEIAESLRDLNTRLADLIVAIKGQTREVVDPLPAEGGPFAEPPRDRHMPREDDDRAKIVL